jgi:hypothetical protein
VRLDHYIEFNLIGSLPREGIGEVSIIIIYLEIYLCIILVMSCDELFIRKRFSMIHTDFPVIIARRPHPFSFRTRSLSSSAAMVLCSLIYGRVARCRGYFEYRPDAFLRYQDGFPILRGLYRGYQMRHASIIFASIWYDLFCKTVFAGHGVLVKT